MTEVERVIDMMYEDYIDYSGNKDKKRKHPSREEYGQIIKHAKLWNMASKQIIDNGGLENV
jgi:hypothetical protein